MSESIEKTLQQILTRLDGLTEQLNGLQTEQQRHTKQIVEFGREASVLRDDVSRLKSASEVKDQQAGFPLTQAIRDREGSQRAAGYSMYASPVSGRRRLIPPPTEAAQSGVSFKPGHRKLGAARYD